MKKTMPKKQKPSKENPIVKNSGPLKTPTKPHQEFQIPASFLSQLNEFCGGGYILLRLNEKREPCVSAQFDTDADAIALYSWGQQYIATVNDVFASNITNSVLGGAPQPDEMGPNELE